MDGGQAGHVARPSSHSRVSYHVITLSSIDNWYRISTTNEEGQLLVAL